MGYSSDLDLKRIVADLKASKWPFLGIVCFCILVALVYVTIAPKVYRSDALIQIEPKDTSPLSSLTSDMNQLTGNSTSRAQSEISIIKSRSVLGETVEDLKLYLDSSPKYFPVVGRLVRRSRQQRAESVEVHSGHFLSRYAFGSAAITLERLDMPDELLGKELTVRALGGGKYALVDEAGNVLLEGAVGETVATQGNLVPLVTLRGKSETGNPEAGSVIRVNISNLVAHEYPTDFVVKRSSWLDVAQSLQSRLDVREVGDNTGIVSVSMTGQDPSEIARIVNSVANNYLRQNVEAKSAKATKSLDFLEQKLPEVKSELDAAEARLAEYREQNSAVDLSSEGQALLGRASAVEDRRSALEMRIEELKQTYTPRHPAVQSAERQLSQLRGRRAELEQEINRLPEEQKNILRLQRDLEVNTQLYTALLNRAQELRIMKAGTVGNVRIIDEAVVQNAPIAPKSKLVVALSLLVGLLLGIGYAVLRTAIKNTVTNPREIEEHLALPVYAVIPHNATFERESRSARRRRLATPILARQSPEDLSVEALRSLRTSLYFAAGGSGMGARSLLITGPAPGVGKTFVSINLAYLLADASNRTIVVDADMRRGRVHEYAGEDRSEGLSELLTGRADLEQIIRHGGHQNLDYIASGAIPPNPSELLMRPEFVDLVEKLRSTYDAVLIDAPPVLAVTDAAVISTAIPGLMTFMVARSGQHPIAELQQAVDRMSAEGQKLTGVIVNGFKQKEAEGGAGYTYYQYEYK